jgi:hypothetical protein
MKKLFLIALILIPAWSLLAQEVKTDKVLFKLPSVNLVDMNGKKINTAELSNNG